MIMVTKCDICGFPIVGQQNYCGGCGVDLRESAGDTVENLPKPTIRQRKNPSKPPGKDSNEDSLRIVKWCWIRNFQLPHVLVLLSSLAQGKSELGFCDCATCNQGYREMLAFIAKIDGKKNVNSASREIVQKAQGVDITKITFDIPELAEIFGFDNKQKSASSSSTEPIQSARIEGGRLLIELDDAVIERAVLNVLSSEQGQNIIKNAYSPKKRKGKKSE